MFPPDGADYRFKVLREVEKVPAKIHDYMDRHEWNDEELIFFR
jgi:hypothetical protein